MAFDEKFDQVNKLITLGKEKGYLLYDEVNDLLPSDVHSAEDLDSAKARAAASRCSSGMSVIGTRCRIHRPHPRSRPGG